VVGKRFSLKTTSYPSEAAAVDAIDQRTIDGALVVSPTGSKLIVVPAAGAAGAAALTTAFTAAAAALRRRSRSPRFTHCRPVTRAGPCRSSS